LELDQSGNILKTINCGQTAFCLSVDQNKDVYLGMVDHIKIYDKEGVQKTRWPSQGDKSLFTSIKVTSQYVYVADAGYFIVWQYDKQGDMISKIGEKDDSRDIPGFIIPSPYFDLAVDPDGFLWVANPGRQSLENYTVEGDLRSSWGTAGMSIEEFCGCCNPSHFAIFDDGSFVTSEKGIARVKVSNRLGILASVVAGPNQFTEGTVGLDLAVDSKNRIYVLDPTRKMVRIFEKRM
jgi:DNA-binding beta-propeller fold protein YncE